MTDLRSRGLSSDGYAVVKAAYDLGWTNTKAIAAVLRTVAFRLSFGHATGAGIIDEEDLRALANEIEGC